MKKSRVEKYRHGSAEYVVLHAEWQRSRGRKPSMQFMGERNPEVALIMAIEVAYFSMNDSYLDGVDISNYTCKECGASNCKLWRESYSSFVDLLCAECASKNQNKDVGDMDILGRRIADAGGITYQIGIYVPAILLESGKRFWHHGAAPMPAVEWWNKLSTLPLQKERAQKVAV